MIIKRIDNAVRGAFWGILLQLYQVLIPFVIRTIIINQMGIEYAGINSLFTSLLSVLNLAELGVGNALVFSMYKPVADEDLNKLCRLLNLYKKYYRIIGCVILTIGICLSPLVPVMIHGDLPKDLNIYILYYLNLLGTVATYLLFSFYNSILLAYQRNDVISVVSILVSTLRLFSQIYVLLFWKDYYLFLATVIITQIVNNLIIMIVVKKKYPQIQPVGCVSKYEKGDINASIRDVFLSRIAGTVMTAADTIVISAYLGLTTLALYQNYYYLMAAAFALINVCLNSCMAGVGNSLITESESKNYNDFLKLTYIIAWIAVEGCAFFYCLYDRIITVWLGQEYILDHKMVISFCIFYYVFVVQLVPALYKDAGGLWHYDRMRQVSGSILNLTLNILLVNVWGLFGVLWSTIISYMLVSRPWLVVNLFKYIFHRNKRDYIMKCIRYAFSAMIATLACSLICMGVSAIINNHIIIILIDIIVVGCVGTFVFLIINIGDKSFFEVLKLIKTVYTNYFHFGRKDG